MRARRAEPGMRFLGSLLAMPCTLSPRRALTAGSPPPTVQENRHLSWLAECPREVPMAEQADVVIAGARCAGSAAAATFARAGRRVIAVDPARFPATTVSTHLLFAAGVAELARVGALERVEKIGAP